jgi:hypothetical protein
VRLTKLIESQQRRQPCSRRFCFECSFVGESVIISGKKQKLCTQQWEAACFTAETATYSQDDDDFLGAAVTS